MSHGDGRLRGVLVADAFCGPIAALPRSGQLLTVGDITFSGGGCATNVAIGLTRQGISAAVVGCVGRDVAAETPLSALREHGVDCSGVIVSDRYSTSKTVILLVEGEDRRYLHAIGANAALNVSHIRRDWAASLSVFYPAVCLFCQDWTPTSSPICSNSVGAPASSR